MSHVCQSYECVFWPELRRVPRSQEVLAARLDLELPWDQKDLVARDCLSYQRGHVDRPPPARPAVKKHTWYEN